MNFEAIKNRLLVVTDRRYREFYRQRAVTDLSARERYADKIAATLPRPDRRTPDAQKLGQALERDGYVMLPGLIDAARIAAMKAYFSSHPCKDPYRRATEFVDPQHAPPGTHVAFFDENVVLNAPNVFDIANDETVLSAVAEALGAVPTISYMTAWWSVPARDGQAQHAEKYHRDVDDWRFIKLFVYLTDVDASAGPHRFMRGSHKRSELTQIRRYEDAEVHAALGAENEVEFTGTAGTCFLENTYGLHRGFPPQAQPRLIFQVLYSLRPVIYGPKSPIGKIGRGGLPDLLDPYVNRVYLKS